MSQTNKNNADSKQQWFDKTQVYRDEIIPIMSQLEKACEKHGLPYIVWVVCKEAKSEYCSGVLMNTCNKKGAIARKVRAVGAIADDKKIGPDSLENMVVESKLRSLFSALSDDEEE